MHIAERRAGDVLVLVVEEVFVGEGSAGLREAVARFIKLGERNILLDLAMVARIDSAGFGEVIRSYTDIRNAGGHLKLLHASERIKTLLSTTKLATIILNYDDEDAAVRSFEQSTEGGGV
ncbi:MAG: hypothetical protein RL681_395 [Candidatus Parcubacteria bacterium]|jgi:anti-sigma B factor antagonist